MYNLEIFQIDAFTDKVFHGNPAAVILLNEWMNDELMQAIAVENHLSETAFVLENEKGFHIRWFSPNGEISLCGHATLAAGFALFELEKCDADQVDFNSLSGTLSVRKKDELYTLDFPKLSYQLCRTPEHVSEVLDQPVLEVYESELDYLVLMAKESDVAKAEVDIKQLLKLPKRGLILTAKGTNSDFYSRCFYPKHDVNEDPVTGSAHCVLIPFWADKLNKKRLHAIQGSTRKGDLYCELGTDRVFISGNCRWYLKGNLVI